MTPKVIRNAQRQEMSHYIEKIIDILENPDLEDNAGASIALSQFAIRCSELSVRYEA